MEEMKNSYDLPQGAVKCNDEEINNILKEVYLLEVDFYNEYGCALHFDFEYKRSKLKEYSVFHPEVEGYLWRHGYVISVVHGQILIFLGWLQSWHMNNVSAGIIYTTGMVSKKEVKEFVRSFKVYVGKQLERYYNSV